MIAFLDFDGVTHGVNAAQFDRRCLAYLASCFERHDARVVIISAWRHELPLTELVRRLGELGTRVIGACGDEPAFTRVPRESVIDGWLAENSYPGPWLAIDDNPGWYGRHEPRVVATNPRTGFTDADGVKFDVLVQQLL